MESWTLVEAIEGVQKVTSGTENPHLDGHHGHQK